MKVYCQKEGVYISGKIKEVRHLLKKYARRFRTVEELIGANIN